MRALLLGLALCVSVLIVSRGGHALEPATGEVILTVSGSISETNSGDDAVFDLAALQALPETSFTTSTIWTDGDQTFTGISLNVLLDLVGATGNNLRAVALNDYAVDVPVSDAVEGGPIIAYFRNGEPMSVRDKGPLWIVYPYDANSDYQTEVVYSRSIWQLRDIEVKN